MTTVNPGIDVPLPVGADPENVDFWDTDDGAISRLVWSLPDRRAKEFDCDVRIVASQRLDGSIVTNKAFEGPLIYVDGADYSILHAQALAAALLNAIRLATQWGSPASD